MPHRYGGRVHAVSKSSDETSGNQLTDRKGRALKNGANDHDYRSNKDGALSAKFVADKDRYTCTEKAAERIASDSNTLNARSFGRAPSCWRVRRVDLREESVRQFMSMFLFGANLT